MSEGTKGAKRLKLSQKELFDDNLMETSDFIVLSPDIIISCVLVFCEICPKTEFECFGYFTRDVDRHIWFVFKSVMLTSSYHAVTLRPVIRLDHRNLVCFKLSKYPPYLLFKNTKTQIPVRLRNLDSVSLSTLPSIYQFFLLTEIRPVRTLYLEFGGTLLPSQIQKIGGAKQDLICVLLKMQVFENVRVLTLKRGQVDPKSGYHPSIDFSEIFINDKVMKSLHHLAVDYFPWSRDDHFGIFEWKRDISEWKSMSHLRGLEISETMCRELSRSAEFRDWRQLEFLHTYFAYYNDGLNVPHPIKWIFSNKLKKLVLKTLFGNLFAEKEFHGLKNLEIHGSDHKNSDFEKWKPLPNLISLDIDTSAQETNYVDTLMSRLGSGRNPKFPRLQHLNFQDQETDCKEWIVENLPDLKTLKINQSAELYTDIFRNGGLQKLEEIYIGVVRPMFHRSKDGLEQKGCLPSLKEFQYEHEDCLITECPSVLLADNFDFLPIERHIEQLQKIIFRVDLYVSHNVSIFPFVLKKLFLKRIIHRIETTYREYFLQLVQGRRHQSTLELVEIGDDDRKELVYFYAKFDFCALEKDIMRLEHFRVLKSKKKKCKFERKWEPVLPPLEREVVHGIDMAGFEEYDLILAFFEKSWDGVRSIEQSIKNVFDAFTKPDDFHE